MFGFTATEASDEQLMTQAASDGDALAVLFDRHHRALFGFFHRMAQSTAVADDLTQEVFFRMLKFRATFREGMRFRPWMYQIARNVHVDHLRKRKGELPMPEKLEIHDGGASAETVMIQGSDLAILRRALQRLPPERRELLVMSRWQGLTYEEIAEIVQCEPGAVKSRVFRAMQQLGETFFRIRGRKSA